MKITQGAFSFLPDLTDEQIAAQVEYCLRNEWAIGVEYRGTICGRCGACPCSTCAIRQA